MESHNSPAVLFLSRLARESAHASIKAIIYIMHIDVLIEAMQFFIYKRTAEDIGIFNRMRFAVFDGYVLDRDGRRETVMACASQFISADSHSLW